MTGRANWGFSHVAGGREVARAMSWMKEGGDKQLRIFPRFSLSSEGKNKLLT